MNNSSSFKITLGHNLIKRTTLVPNDLIAEEDQTKNISSDNKQEVQANSVELDRWMQLWSKAPHNPYSNNGCND